MIFQHTLDAVLSKPFTSVMLVDDMPNDVIFAVIDYANRQPNTVAELKGDYILVTQYIDITMGWKSAHIKMSKLIAMLQGYADGWKL